MSTAASLPRAELSYSGLWCGEATLESFSITVRGKQATCLSAARNHLRAAGYNLTDEVAPWADEQPTLARFIAEHPVGDYVLFTTDHILSLRDGQLTDTETTAGGRRRVREAQRVERARA